MLKNTSEEKKTKDTTLQHPISKISGKEEFPGYETGRESAVAAWNKLYNKYVDKIKADNTFKKEKQNKTCKSRWITGKQTYHVVRFSIAFGPFACLKVPVALFRIGSPVQTRYFNAR